MSVLRVTSVVDGSAGVKEASLALDVLGWERNVSSVLLIRRGGPFGGLRRTRGAF